MFKHIAEYNKNRNITLIAHNASGYDSYLVMKQFTLNKPPVCAGKKILSVTISNPYTPKNSIIKWRRDENIKGTKDIKQQITLRCSYQHVLQSLDKWGKSFEIPQNLRKTGCDHNSIKKDTYLEKQSEWEPYLRKDISALACCVIKYNNVMKDLVDENMVDNLTAPSLTFKGWLKDLKEDNISLYSHVDPFIRNYIRRSVKGGRVSANIKKFESNIFPEIISILRDYFFNQSSENVNLVDCFNKYFNSPIETKKEIAEIIKNRIPPNFTSLMAFDATSLYPSAMIDKESEYPDAKYARAFNRLEEEQKFLYLFNTQKFRPRTGIFTILYKYPDNLFFQPIPAKDKIIVSNKKQELIRFRNGVISDTLTSVDIQEIVRAGGTIINIYQGIVYERNMEKNPFNRFIKRLFDQRLKYKKEENEVGSNLVKLLMNSLYGKTVQKDINTKLHVWITQTWYSMFDPDLMINCDKINDNQWLVEMKKEQTEEAPNASNKEQDATKLLPSHIGSFILSHSKRIMNNFVHLIDGFKKPIL